MILNSVKLQFFFFMLFFTEATQKVLHSNSLSGCVNSCGNVIIPYPFGIGDGCYKEGFDITCNSSFSPSKPFISNTTIELIDITLPKGQARAYKHIDWVCYNQTDVLNYSIEVFNLTYLPAYRISNTNKFTAIGCRTTALIGGYQSLNLSELTYVSGCVTVCDALASTFNGTCAGVGCCQIAIPKGLKGMETGFGPPLTFTDAWKFNPCSYSFIAEPEWYNFSSADLVGDYFNLTYIKGAPVVLDWSIGNLSCEEAQRNLASYECLDSNSKCFNSSNGEGYFCNCSTGYQGNPYLPNGCEDINECQIPSEYPCYFDCTNIVGNYTCSCPPGTNGDATVKNGCIPIGSSLPLYLKALIGMISGIFLLILISCWVRLGIKKTKLIHAKHKFFEQNGGLLLQQQMNSHQGTVAFKLFAQEELEKATNKFHSSRILGRGGYGIVYKGILDDNRIVAIKKSRVMNGNQTKEFAKEMFILSQINHKNVIKLLGCCLEVEVPMLVYEFVSHGNLYQYIHNNECLIPLISRLRIAAESADALAYLHSSASPSIIHGDVKSSNILLDEKYSAKVSDFGASKIDPKDHEELATLVQGTCGYLDPEYLITCQLTEKSDVYSFGVVILELLTRRKVLDFYASGEDKNLVPCFLSAMKEDKIFMVLDVELENEDVALINEVAKIAMLCLKITGDERPTMKEVAEELERLLKLKGQQIAKLTKNAERTNNLSGADYNVTTSSQYLAHNEDIQEPIAMNSELIYPDEASRSYSLEVQGLLSIESGR